jgi:protein ImuB
LWLALYLPALALEALPTTSNRPRAVLGGARRTLLYAVDAAAADAGVQVGMSACAAFALRPDIELLERAPRAELRARDALLVWAGQFTSHCAALAGDCLVLEIGASRRVFGGLGPLLERINAELTALAHQAQIGMAPTPAAAALLARHRPGTQVQTVDALPGVLGPLPLVCLDIDARLVARLQGFGLRSINDCRRLPRAALGRRVGSVLLATLDQLFGIAPQPLAPFRPPAQFRRALELPAPLDGAPQLRPVLARLLLELRGFLRAREACVQALRLELVCVDAQRVPVLLRLTQPSGDVALLLALLAERLDQVILPGPVAGLLLIGESLVEAPVVAQDLFDSAAGEPLPQLLDRLRARLGDAAVNGISATADHRPERGWRYCPVGEGEAARPLAGRPAWLLRTPQRLRVAAGVPCLDGRLTLLDGPERIEGGWWDSADVARDYYTARQRGGRRLWIYRERRPGGGWYLHGLFA